MKTKTILIVLILTLAIAGAYFFPRFVQGPVGGSPVGTQFGTQKIASVAWSLASGSATSTSLLNTDQNTRIIDSSFLACEGFGSSRTAYTGAGLANLIVRAATTSTPAPSIVSNTNYASNLTSVPTTTPWGLISTSTEGILTGYSRVWPSGTYLTFFSNATNTAQCTAGVSYYNL